MHESDDTALLIAAGSGDRLAFRRLYDSVGPKLYAIIRRINRETASSEEILQDVFPARLDQCGKLFPAGNGLAYESLS